MKTSRARALITAVKVCAVPAGVLRDEEVAVDEVDGALREEDARDADEAAEVLRAWVLFGAISTRRQRMASADKYTTSLN